MKRIAVIVAFLIVYVSPLLADQIYWTGQGGSSQWTDAGNWSGGEVPGKNDDVTIPKGAVVMVQEAGYIHVNQLTNHGNFMMDHGSLYTGATIHCNQDIINTGQIHSQSGLPLNIECGGTLENEGRIRCQNGDLSIRCDDLWNKETVSISSSNEDEDWHRTGELNIEVKQDFVNEGYVGADESVYFPIQIQIECGNLTEDGVIYSGDNEAAQQADIRIGVRENVSGTGDIQGGGRPSPDEYEGPPPPPPPPPPLRMSCGGTLRAPYLYSVWAERPAKAADTETLDTPIALSADTLIIDKKILTFNTLHLYGRYISFELSEQWEIWAAEGLEIHVAEGGTLDLSGTQTAEAIGAGNFIRIFADNIIPPAGGLNSVFTLPPETASPQDDIRQFLLLTQSDGAGAGETGRFKLLIQNHSMKAQTLDYKIHSSHGWIQAEGQVNSLNPFVWDSVQVDFNIPGETAAGTVDDVQIIINSGAVYADTLTTDIACLETQETAVSKHSRQPDAFALSAFPNPFNPETRIQFNLEKKAAVKIEIIDAAGRIVCEVHQGILNPGRHSFNWDASEYGGGVYFVRLQTNEASRVLKCCYVK